jgi:hypothetical protein
VAKEFFFQMQIFIKNRYWFAYFYLYFAFNMVAVNYLKVEESEKN